MPYSTRFYSNTFDTGSPVLYTVPADYVAVIRDMRLYAATGSTAEVAIEIINPGPATTIIFFNNDVAPGDYIEWQGRVVADAGAEIIGVTTESGITAHISGYLLAAP